MDAVKKSKKTQEDTDQTEDTSSSRLDEQAVVSEVRAVHKHTNEENDASVTDKAQEKQREDETNDNEERCFRKAGTKSGHASCNDECSGEEEHHDNMNESPPSKKVSFLEELRRKPSERHWNQAVDCSDPANILRRLRLLSGKIVNDSRVQLIVILLILINAIMMGIGTCDFVEDNAKINRGFEAADRFFLLVFTIELAMQLFYHGLALFTDGWLLFDFIIVIASWSLESLQIVRAFRVFRAFRLVTRLGPLRELVMSLGQVMPRIYAISVLLILTMYIFSVMFTELFRDLQLNDNYFGSLDASLFTCFEMMTLNWASISRQVTEYEPWAWFLFSTYISITGFIVFNLIVAVVCDAVSIIDQEIKAEAEAASQEFQQEQETDRLGGEAIRDLSSRVDRITARQKETQDALRLLSNELSFFSELGIDLSELDTSDHTSTSPSPHSTLLE